MSQHFETKLIVHHRMNEMVGPRNRRGAGIGGCSRPKHLKCLLIFLTRNYHRIRIPILSVTLRFKIAGIVSIRCFRKRQ